MTLLGKIFTVLILVMSLVFMSFAVVVFATHKNWRDEVQGKPGAPGLRAQLDEEKKKVDSFKETESKLEADLASEKADKAQRLAKLDQENKALKEENAALVKKDSELQQSLQASVNAAQTAQEQVAAKNKEAESLRADVQKANKERDDQAKEVVRVTDEFQQAVGELKRHKDRNLALAAQLEKCRALLRANDLDENKDYSGKPPKLEGRVLSVVGNELVEISLGSDDGLMKGHHMEVFRLDGAVSSYLGRIEIVRTDPDRSVGKIDPSFRKGAIQKDDRVASQLK